MTEAREMSTDYPLHVHELVEGEAMPEIEAMREPSETTIAALLEALRGVVATFAMNNAEPVELRDSLYHPIEVAGLAIAKAERRS